MSLTDQVRETCRSIAESARFVSIDLDRLETFEAPDPAPEPDFVEGTPADVADFVLTLDSINFGSGWFPTLRKREGLSGYLTVASALADRWRVCWAVVGVRTTGIEGGRRCRCARAGAGS